MLAFAVIRPLAVSAAVEVAPLTVSVLLTVVTPRAEVPVLTVRPLPAVMLVVVDRAPVTTTELFTPSPLAEVVSTTALDPVVLIVTPEEDVLMVPAVPARADRYPDRVVVPVTERVELKVAGPNERAPVVLLIMTPVPADAAVAFNSDVEAPSEMPKLLEAVTVL
jgi:hypothetical protein